MREMPNNLRGENIYYRDLCFSGSGAELSELPWGQRFMWYGIKRVEPYEQHLNLVWIQSVPENAGLATVLSALESLLNKHETLRTRYHIDDFGHPKQEVIGKGKITVEIRDVDAEGVDPSNTAWAVWREFKNFHHDLARDFPVKVAVISQGNQPRLLVVGLSHIATDGWGVGRLREDLASFMDGGERCPENSVSTSWQPRDQLRYEQSPDALKRKSRTLEYLDTQFKKFPSTMFWWRRERSEQPRYWHGHLDSPALLPAVSKIYEAHKITPASAILAAFSVAIGCKACRNTCCLFVNYSNRDHRNVNSVANYVQSVPIEVDLAGSSFWRLMKAAHLAVLNSYKFAAYPHEERLELIRRVGNGRGIRIVEDCLFNSLWRLSGSDLKKQAHMDDRGVDLLAQPGAFNWKEGIDRGAIVYIETEPGSISLIADTKFVHPEEFEVILRLVESLLIRGAREDFNPNDLLVDHFLRRVPDPTWAYIDKCWINMEETQCLIAEVTGLEAVEAVAVSEGNGEDKILVAYLPEGRTKTELDKIRLRCLEALPRWRNAMVPHRFVVADRG
jgi:hypothetical protein